MAAQRVLVNTNPITHLGAYNEPLPLAGGTGGTIPLPLEVGINKGQQIPQPFMQPPLPPNLEAIRKAVQELYEHGLGQFVSHPTFIGCDRR